MQVKMYYFKYGNRLDRFCQKFLSFGGNFCTPIFMFIIMMIVMGITGVGKYVDMRLVMLMLLFAILVGGISAISYCFCFKGVILYDTYLEIQTRTIGIERLNPKITINYSDIVSAYNGTFNLRYDRRKARKSFIVGDYTDYVELTLIGGKQFCFSVDNQDDFLNELLLRRNAINEKTDSNGGNNN